MQVNAQHQRENATSVLIVIWLDSSGLILGHVVKETASTLVAMRPELFFITTEFALIPAVLFAGL